MPDKDLSITAEYDSKIAKKYNLSVTNGTGSGAYEVGEVIDIAANLAPSSRIFDKWTGDTANIENINQPNTTLIMPKANLAITAEYTDKSTKQYTLSVGSGTGSGEYVPGRIVTIMGHLPAKGMIFDRWTGDTQHLPEPTKIVSAFFMPAENVSVTALYKEKPIDGYNLEVVNGTGSDEYEAGEVINIDAQPADQGYIFDKWIGQTQQVAHINQPNTVLAMPEHDVQVQATYRQYNGTTKSLTVHNGTGDGQYQPGRVVSIDAKVPDIDQDVPDQEYIFTGWVGQTSHVKNVNIPNTTLVMPETDVEIKANYEHFSQVFQPGYTIIVIPGDNFSPSEPMNNNANLMSSIKDTMSRLVHPVLDFLNPMAIAQPQNNNGTMSRVLPPGSLVNLVAPEAPEGYTFDKWIGQTANVYNINLSETLVYMPSYDIKLIATYEKISPELSLEVGNGTGDGSYSTGEIVDIVTDSAPAGQMFDKWQGQTAGVNNVNLNCTTLLMPDTDVKIYAVYRDKPQQDQTLRVQNGTGSGKYQAGQYITIQSGQAPKGQMFARWTGQISNVQDVNESKTSIYMPPHEATVVASFSPYHTITATAGQGGTIAPNKEVKVLENETKEFIITPKSGYSIDKVTGCSGTLNGNTYTTGPISSDCQVQVRFSRNEPPAPTRHYSIEVKSQPSYAGTVTGGGEYASNEVAILSAQAKDGYKLSGWMENGHIVSHMSTYFFNVTRSRALTAMFEPLPAPGNELGFDFNQDGRFDLGVINQKSKDVLLGFMGGLTLLDGGRLVTLPAGWKIVDCGIFKNQPALIARHNKDEGIYLIFVNGLEITDLSLVGNLPQTYSISHVADLNGNGNWDLVVKNDSSRDVYAVYMNGTLPEHIGYFGGLDKNTTIPLPADLTGDDKSELILRNNNTGQLFMSKIAPQGWSNTPIGTLPMEWELLTRGYFNLDDMADLVFRHNPSAQTWVCYMDGPAVKDTHLIGEIPADEWEIITVADYNGDGLSDTLWLHKPTRMMLISLATEDKLLGQISTFLELPKDWEVIK